MLNIKLLLMYLKNLGFEHTWKKPGSRGFKWKVDFFASSTCFCIKNWEENEEKKTIAITKSTKYLIIFSFGYMEKAHVAAGGPFCGVRCRSKFFGRFYTVLSVAAPIFGRFYAVLPVAASKNYISVGDRITGSPGFFHVCSFV